MAIISSWLQFLDLEPSGIAASWDLLATGPWRFLIESINRRPWVVAGSVLLGLLNIGFWGLFAVGLRRLMPRNKAMALTATLVVAYFALAAGGPWGQSRFRVPYVGALCVIAAAAFDRGARPKSLVETAANV